MSEEQKRFLTPLWMDVVLGAILVGVVLLVLNMYNRRISVDGADFESGSTLANLAGSIRDDTGFNDGRENMGNEPPVFWNAGDMADIANWQQDKKDNAELSMQDLDPLNLAFINKDDLTPQNRAAMGRTGGNKGIQWTTEGYQDDRSLGVPRSRGYASGADGMTVVPSVNGQPLNPF